MLCTSGTKRNPGALPLPLSQQFLGLVHKGEEAVAGHPASDAPIPHTSSVNPPPPSRWAELKRLPISPSSSLPDGFSFLLFLPTKHPLFFVHSTKLSIILVASPPVFFCWFSQVEWSSNRHQRRLRLSPPTPRKKPLQ